MQGADGETRRGGSWGLLLPVTRHSSLLTASPAPQAPGEEAGAGLRGQLEEELGGRPPLSHRA